MPSIGPMELAIVLVIALIILGPRRLPAAGRSLGSSLREFKEGITSTTSPAAAATADLEEAR
jgi:sec-independent protein translocase protein TatA